MAPKNTLTIGELAAQTGLTADALRYYERRGLVAPVPRTSGGFRVYGADAVERLRFIKQAQRHGLTLAEIRELVRLETRQPAGQCRQVQALLQRKVAELDVRLTELQEFRRTLAEYLTRCNHTLAQTPDAPCPVVRDLRGVAPDIVSGGGQDPSRRR